MKTKNKGLLSPRVLRSHKDRDGDLSVDVAAMAVAVAEVLMAAAGDVDAAVRST